MKSIQNHELILIEKQLKTLIGSRLNVILFDEQCLQLQVFLKGQSYIIHANLDLNKPYLFFAKAGEVKPIKPKVKPITLFIKSHCIGQKMSDFKTELNKGRVLKILFANGAEIELRLFPKGVNVGAKCEGKEIWAKAPKPLSEMPVTEADTEARSNLDFFKLWTQQVPKNEIKQISPLDIIKKKYIALEKVIKQKKEIEKNIYEQVAKSLEENQSFDIEEPFKKFINTEESIYENINTLYQKSKKEKLKLTGYNERIAQLEAEIQKLSSGDSLEPTENKSSNEKNQSLLSQSLSRGRTKVFNELVKGYIGKSGKDNLALLRKSKPWYIWMHLKDVPGSHLILELPRGQSVSAELIKEAALWLISETEKNNEGIFEVQHTECRFIQPIKGDKHGRVTVKNQKVIRVKSK